MKRKFTSGLLTGVAYLAPQATIGFHAEEGRDIAVTIGGETAIGKGQILIATEGTTAEGLAVEFNKTLETTMIETIDEVTGEISGQQVILDEHDPLTGNEVDGYVSQQSLAYHIDSN